MIINYSHGDTVEFEKTAVALGTFDGLHVAHMKIIRKAQDYAEKNGIKCGVMMFDSIPANVLGVTHMPQLMSVYDRYKLLPDVDFVYTESFDCEFSKKTPEEFVHYLKTTLKAVAVSVGYNYRFGRGAAGDAQLLKKLCEKEQITVFISDKTEFSGDAVSSTRIRKLVTDGFVKEAAQLLGRPFFLTGIVMHGFRNGHKMGIPTANLTMPENIVQPKEGVYAGFCIVDGKKLPSVINVGTNPTFNGQKVTVECHLIDFTDDLYNKEITVYFIEYIRNEIKFNSPHELIAQIKEDIRFTKNELMECEQQLNKAEKRRKDRCTL